MKYILQYCFLLVILLSSFLFSQQLSQMIVVGKPELQPSELMPHEPRDANGKVCAGLIITTDLDGLKFNSYNHIVKMNADMPGRYLLFLSPDEQVVEVHKSGFEPLKLILNDLGISKMQSGEVWQIKITGNPKNLVIGKGSLIVSTVPDGATLTIDGLPGMWSTPTKKIDILSTNWRLIITKPRYDTLFVSATVIKDSVVHLDSLRLVPKFGFIRFEDMSGAVATIDGREARLNVNIEQSLGIHRIAITDEQYGKKSLECTISPGEVKVLTLADFLAPGFFDISTDVLADIYLDGKPLGNTSVREQAMPGKHEIFLRHRTLGELKESVVLQPAEVKEVFLSMLPSRNTATWLCLIPGASQIYIQQKTRGYFYLSAFLASAGASVYFLTDYQKQRNDYENLIQEYNSAQTAVEAAQYHNAIKAKYVTLENSKKDGQTSSIAIAAVYVVSILDRLIFSTELGYRQRESTISMDMHGSPNRDGIQLTWRIPR